MEGPKVSGGVIGGKKTIVHVYALSWNEHDLLPLFFKNYSWVDKFIFLDYDSDPVDQRMMMEGPKAEIVSMGIKQLDDEYIRHVKNNIWKQSRGEADWVVVQDFDEFVYHPDMPKVLEKLTSDEYTVVQCEQWDVVGDRVPTEMAGLRGFRNPRADKCLMFNPNKIEEINYIIGAHGANPTGTVKISERSVAQMHMKFACGLDYFLWRRVSSSKKLCAKNRAMKWGCEGLNPVSDQITEFREAGNRAVVIPW